MLKLRRAVEAHATLADRSRVQGHAIAEFQVQFTSYGAAIGACEKAGQWHVALELIREISNVRPEPSTICYVVIIDVCCFYIRLKRAAAVVLSPGWTSEARKPVNDVLLVQTGG